MAKVPEILLLQITLDDFVRLWSCFELVLSAKKWDKGKQCIVVLCGH